MQEVENVDLEEEAVKLDAHLREQGFDLETQKDILTLTLEELKRYEIREFIKEELENLKSKH